MNKRTIKFTIILIALFLMYIIFAKRAYAAQNLENGIYKIKAAQNPELVFDVAGASKNLGAELGLWHDYYSMNQEFYITKLNDGSYTIKARHSNYILDVFNALKTEGTKLCQYKSLNQDNQKFYIEPTSDGYYKIKCKHSNLYLDVSNGAATAGSKIQTYKNNNNITQKFVFEKQEPLKGGKTIENGRYQILLNADNNMAVSVENSSPYALANVLLKKNSKIMSQKFDIEYDNAGFYTIKSAYSGQALEVYGDMKGVTSNICQNVVGNNDCQKWAIIKNNDGTYYIVSKSNELNMASAGSKNDGTNIYTYSQLIGDNNRKFKLVLSPKKESKQTITNGVYKIRPLQNKKVCLDIAGASVANNANVGLWTSNADKNQKFNITYQNGYYTIIASHSGKAVDVYGGRCVQGTNVLQWTSNGQANQQWIIEKTANGNYKLCSRKNEMYMMTYDGAANGSNIFMGAETNQLSQEFILEKIEPVSGTKTINDGRYQILLADNNNMALTVEGGSTYTGAKLLLGNNTKGIYQRFDIKYNGDGTYSIKGAHSGYSLDIFEDYKGIGTRVIQNGANNTDKQKWVIKKNDDGTYYIFSKYTGTYLATNEKNTDKTDIICESNIIEEKYRKFVIVPISPKTSEKTIKNANYKIKSVANNNLYLDIAKASVDNDANLQLWEGTTNENQVFTIKYVNGYYTIVAKHSNKSIDVYGGRCTEGTNVLQWTQNGQANQQWIIEKAEDGNYKICSRKTEMYLMSENNPKNGSNIYMGSEQKNLLSQEFILEEVKEKPVKITETSYKISPYLNTSEYLEVVSSSANNNANIAIAKDKRKKSQIYDIKYIDNESFKIIACHSQKVLTVNGENVEQNEYNGSQNQLWKTYLNKDGTYSIVSNGNDKYLTVDGNGTDGNNISVKEFNESNAQKFLYKKITDGSKGTYGRSGLSYAGDSRGKNLEYYKYGCGENVYFATFVVHGFEDNWNWDGAELKYIADQFYNKLITDKNVDLAKNWTIYIFPTVNPDGLNYGYDKNGPGRTTLYSAAPDHLGIDINRSWQVGSSYKTYTNSRNYNGTAGFQAYEAVALRDFLIANKSTDGKTILVDLHGWENSLIGSTNVLKYFAEQFPEATKKYEHYGQQYLITWARSVLGAEVGLVELPTWISSATDVRNANLAGRYITSVYNMLNNVSINTYTNSGINNAIGNINVNEELANYEIAVAGAINKGNPTAEQIESAKNKTFNTGVYIIPGFEENVLNIINSVTNNTFGLDNNHYLKVLYSASSKNKYDLFFEGLINSNKRIMMSNMGELYFRDSFTGNIESNIYESFDWRQPYDYAKYGDKMLIDITKNGAGKLTNIEIMDSLIELIK